MLTFAKRNIKELVRDPVKVIFCLILPLFLLVIFQQFNIPALEYKINYFTPSIILFSYSFLSLFVAQLISEDRSTLLLTRLFISPMKSINYILGYTLALIPLALIQSIIFFTVGILFFSLPLSINILYSILILIPVSILFIAVGILIGCISKSTQASAIGSLMMQVIAFTSGMWFSIDMVGNIYKIICKVLPFSHALDLIRNVLNNNGNIFIQLLVVLVYTIIIFLLATYIFNKKKISDNK